MTSSRRDFMKTVSVGVGAMPLLTLTGCTKSQLLQTLQGIIAAAELVLPLIMPIGIPAIVVDLVNGYLQSAMQGVENVSLILNDPTKTALQKVPEITMLIAAIIKPHLPPGTPVNIDIAVNNVAAALEHFLENFKPVINLRNAKAVNKSVKLTNADKGELNKIQNNALATMNKLRAIPKRQK